MRVTRENLSACKAFVDFWEDHVIIPSVRVFYRHPSLQKKPLMVNHMDFENVEVVGHEAHYHQRLFLEAWMSVKDPNAGNDHMVFPEVYKCLART